VNDVRAVTGILFGGKHGFWQLDCEIFYPANDARDVFSGVAIGSGFGRLLG
tara:strand:- start:827 stop:979 length:153 start_codon:yes stop_codon:yes gene_type:complete